jgi:DNA repair protein RadC
MQRTGKPSEPLLNAQGVCRFVRGVRNRDRESFVALHLDTRNRVIGVEEIAKGTLTSVEVHPREVFKGAILNNASSLIFVHNHPSGDPSPSRQDIELTSRLIDVGRLVGIPVRDHVVVGDECHSLRAEEMAHMQWGAAPQKRRRRRKKSR